MTEKTHYDTLGVAKDANAADIKKAYHKLVRQYHPDVSKDPDADKKTSEINQAYNVLKDPEKRAEYDAMLANPYAGREQAGFNGDFGGYHFDERHFGDGQPFGSGDFRFDDIFSAFGYAQQQRAQRPNTPVPGEDQHAEITIDIAAAYEGSERGFTLEMPTLTATGEMAYTRKNLHVKIPKGISEGQQIRLRGQGLPGYNGGENGDLYLKVRFRETPQSYVKDRKDVYQRLDLAPWTAVLGGTVEVATPAGKLGVTIPANSRGGQNLRLKGKGIPAKEAGDLYLMLNIELPQANDAAARALWQQLADHYAKD